MVPAFSFIIGAAVDVRRKEVCAEPAFFSLFPKVALGTLLRVIFNITQDAPQIRISTILNLTPKLVSQICRRLQDLYSLDLQERPVIPFGGPGVVVKCDESKFNHKAKVLYNFHHFLPVFYKLSFLP